jgi:hypothetical protein
VVVFRRGHCQPLQVGTGQWPLLPCHHGVVGVLGELVVGQGRCVVLGGCWWAQVGVGLVLGLAGQGGWGSRVGGELGPGGGVVGVGWCG